MTWVARRPAPPERPERMTPRTLRVAAFLAAALAAAPVTATPLPPLIEDSHVTGEFVAAAVGDEIRKNCPTISARVFVVLGRINELGRYARDRGYSDAEIDAFRKSEANKAELDRRRDAYLAGNGVVAGDAESYCRLGRREIEARSRIGTLLRSR